MAHNMRKITMKDVAREAGVSVMSVSKALNNKGSLSQPTKTRIIETAERLGYRPNFMAKGLRISQSSTLGVVVADSSHLLFSKMLRGIEDAALARGYNVIITNTDASRQKEARAVDMLLERRIDGLILAAPLRTDQVSMNRLRNFGTPFVMLMRDTNAPFVDVALNDNFNGGYTIARYLIDTGSRDIYFINLHKSSKSGIARARGYRAAFLEKKLHFDPARMSFSTPDIKSGYNAMRAILDGGVTSGDICCGCDLIAIGACDAITERGFSIPGNFRVCGYDDIELCDHLRHPLTTIRQPMYELGERGVGLLMDRIENPRLPARRVVLDGELIIRSST